MLKGDRVRPSYILYRKTISLPSGGYDPLFTRSARFLLSSSPVFRPSFLARWPIYAITAWWGYTTAADKQRLDAVIRCAIYLRRCTRLQLYRQCDPTVNHLVEDMGDELFTSVITGNNDKHVLSHILLHPNNHTYNPEPRRHKLTLAIKGDARNFSERQLFKLRSIDHYNFVFCTSFSIHCIVLFFVFTVLLRSDSGFCTLNWNWIEIELNCSCCQGVLYPALPSRRTKPACLCRQAARPWTYLS